MKRALLAVVILLSSPGCSSPGRQAAEPPDASGPFAGASSDAETSPQDVDSRAAEASVGHEGDDGPSGESGATTDGPPCGVGQGFSADLAPYPVHPTAATTSVDAMFNATLASGELPRLSVDVVAKRKEILQMYKDFGMDPSLDGASFYAATLASYRPKRWSTQTPQPLSASYKQPFSIDAPVYHRVPCGSPRAELPAAYFRSAQLFFVHGFDDTGYAVVPSGMSAQVATFHSDPDGKTYTGHVPSSDLTQFVPQNGDRQVSFIDSVNNTYVDCIGPSISGFDLHGFFTQQSLPNLGDQGGTIAAGMSTLAGLIRAGEATDAIRPIPHAIYFATDRMWKARVYPGAEGDAFLFGNAPDPKALGGLVPYGAVVQLDPTLDLGSLGLPRPVERILEAMQTYGAYNINASGGGGVPFAIYTATDDTEFTPFGPIYTGQGDGLQERIAHVLATSRLYIVPPIIKR